MALPRSHSLLDLIVQATITNCTTGSFAIVRAPCNGRFYTAGGVTGSAITGGTATTSTEIAFMTFFINATAQCSFNFQVTNCTAAGFSNQNTFNPAVASALVTGGDELKWVWTANGSPSPSGGGPIYCWAQLRADGRNL